MDSLSPGRIYGTTSLDTGTNWRRLVPPPLFPTLWLAGHRRLGCAFLCLSVSVCLPAASVGGWGSSASAVSHVTTKQQQWFAISPRQQNSRVSLHTSRAHVCGITCGPKERKSAQFKVDMDDELYYHNPENLQHRCSEIYGNRSSKRSGRSSWSSIIEFI